MSRSVWEVTLLAGAPRVMRDERRSRLPQPTVLPGGWDRRGGHGGDRLRRCAWVVASRGWRLRRRLAAELGCSAGVPAGRPRRPLCGPGHRGRGRRVRLRHRLCAPAPGARGAAPGRGAPLPRPDGAVHDGHGGAVDRPGPAGAVRVLGPHRDHVLLPDRVRPPASGGPAVGADGVAGDRRVGGAAADRDPDRAGRARYHLDPGTAGPGRPGRADADPGRRPDRRWRPGQERPGAPPLLAAPGDGRPHPGVGLPALGGHGRRRGVPAQPPASAAGDQPGAAGRPAGGRAGLDGRRGPAGAGRRPPQAAARLLDHRPSTATW
jgi:hypothetical protein